MRTRLTLAFDGSPSSVHAAELLAAHAQGELLETMLLNVRPRGAEPPGREFEAAAERLRAAGITMRRQLRVGRAAPAILEEIRRQRPAAVVLGTRGAGALHGYALGSVALRVVHKARVPALLVKERDRLPAALGRRLCVVLATDGSAPATRAARRLAAWRPWLGELEIHLLWVQQPLTYLETVLPPHDDVTGQWSRKEGDKATREAVALCKREGMTHRVHFSVGDAALEVRSLADETSADLVALGTRGLGAAHHALVGSVALKSAVASPVPTLLVP